MTYDQALTQVLFFCGLAAFAIFMTVVCLVLLVLDAVKDVRRKFRRLRRRYRRWARRRARRREPIPAARVSKEGYATRLRSDPDATLVSQ